MKPEDVKKMIEESGGKVEWMSPYGATASFPLPKSHWLYADGSNVPPMPFKMGKNAMRGGMTRQEFAEKIRQAGRYAVRCATMNGKDQDFDPDALIQNLVVGMLGYWTEDGLSPDTWANPKRFGGTEIAGIKRREEGVDG